jgi:hypothetical protein
MVSCRVGSLCRTPFSHDFAGRFGDGKSRIENNPKLTVQALGGRDKCMFFLWQSGRPSCEGESVHTKMPG